MHTLMIEPWSEAAFAPFGQAIMHKGTATLEDQPSVFDHSAEALTPYCGLFRVETAVALPHIVTQLERHPFSAQSFVPLVKGGCLAIVCPSFTDNTPDLAGLRAFEVPPDQGIMYNKNVWHHSMLAFSIPSQWLVLMRKTERNDDNVFWILDAVICVAKTPI